MDEYKRRRRRSRAVMSMFLDSIGGSIDNVDVATFDSDGNDLKALIVGIDPVQDLHGYDSPWPSGGGKNKFNADRTASTPTQTDPSASTRPREMDTTHYFAGITRNNYYGASNVSDLSVSGGEISVTVTAGGFGVGFPVAVSAETAYTLSFTNTNNGKISVGYYDASWNYLSNRDGTTPSYTFTTPADCAFAVFVVTPNVFSEPSTTASVKNVQLELGSTATTYAPYSNICPITGHSSVNVIVSPTLNPLDGTITNLPLGTTVYGGQLDVLTGVLTDADAEIASYNGEAINEPWISSMDAYSSGDTPTTGAQVVYPLSAPTTIQLTGQQIATFVGTNHVWCDSGKIIHLEY